MNDMTRGHVNFNGLISERMYSRQTGQETDSVQDRIDFALDHNEAAYYRHALLRTTCTFTVFAKRLRH
jgi:hypothetical protein